MSVKDTNSIHEFISNADQIISEFISKKPNYANWCHLHI